MICLPASEPNCFIINLIMKEKECVSENLIKAARNIRSLILRKARMPHTSVGGVL